MSRFPTTAVILVTIGLAAVGVWRLLAGQEHDRFVAVDKVRHSPTAIRFAYAVDHERGRIAREEWRFANVDGRSTASYTAVDRNGNRASFDERVDGYDVTFLFEKLVQDGIWTLQTRPLRGNDPDVHSVQIDQIAGAEHGAHAFRFSDPHYLATSAGREYRIQLDRSKPVPDILKLDSTSTADDRYLKIVTDVESFGSDRFKRTLAEAREKLLKS
jgi:hypothetical protein